MFPSGQGRVMFLNYDYQDQNQNWSGTSRAPAANNSDKEIETDFFSLGLQYMFNYNWGVQAEIPYGYRTFRTEDDAGSVVTRHWSQPGDGCPGADPGQYRPGLELDAARACTSQGFLSVGCE